MNILEQFYILFQSDADKAQKDNAALEASALQAAAAIDATATANHAAGTAAAGAARSAAAASQASAAATISGAAAAAEAANKARTAIIGEADAHIQAYRAAREHAAAEDYLKHRTGGGLRANEMLNLTRQFADVSVTAAMGMSPFMILVQQGPQIADIFQMAKARGVGFAEVLGSIGAKASKLLPLLKGLALPVAALGVLFGGAGIAKGQVESLTALGDLAEKSHAAVEDVDALTRAIRDQGSTSKQAQAQIGKFADHMTDAFGNAKSAAGKALAALGVSAGDAKGVKPTTAALADLAGALEHVSKAKATATLHDVGITDPGAIALLLQGRAAVEGQIAAQKALGVTTTEMVERAKKYRQETERLHDAMNDLRNLIANAFLPMLTNTVRAFRDFAEWIYRNRVLVQGFGIAALAAIAVVSAMVWTTWVPAFAAAAVAVIAATWPILLIGAAVAGLAAIFAACYEDVVFFLRGQPSLIGELVNKYEWVRKTVHAIGDAFKGLKREGATLWDHLTAGAHKFGGWLDKIGSSPGLVSFFRGVWAVAGPILRLMIDGAMALARFLGPILLATVVPVAREIWRQWGDIFRLFNLAAAGIGAAFTLIAKFLKPIWTELFDGWLRQLYMLIDGVRRLFHLKPDAQAQDFLAGSRGRLVGAGQDALGFAATVPFAALGQSPATLAAMGGHGPAQKTTHVQIDKVDVHTQATDAAGIANAFGGALGNELRRANLNFDDGIDR